MINYENFVHIEKAAKQCKKIGEFIMFKCQSGNLLVTNQFILNLTSEQFWKMQCRLEIPERGKWYLQQKDCLEESDREPSLENLESRYKEWLEQAGTEIYYTKITLNSLYYLYANQTGGYTVLPAEKIDIIQAPETFWRGGDIVVIDGLHIFTVTKDETWQDNEFLYKGAAGQ